MPRAPARVTDDQNRIVCPTHAASPSALHNVIADRIADQLGDGMKAKFLHDVSPVGFHGFDTDLKNVGDLFVGLAFGHQFDDLSLARTEPAGGSLRGHSGGGAARSEEHTSEL